MGLFFQIYTFIKKNLLVEFVRQPLQSTFLSLVLPVIFTLGLAYTQNIFGNPSYFGIGTPNQVLSLQDALSKAQGVNTVAFVDNGFGGGPISDVINILSSQVQTAGKNVVVVHNSESLGSVCPVTLREVTDCYGAIIFNSSPSEGSGGDWNYTIALSPGLGSKTDVRSAMNDVQVYNIPLQRAVDDAITRQTSSVSQDGRPIEQLLYTSQTEDDVLRSNRAHFQNTIRSALAPAFFVALLGIGYHLTGLMTLEREIGMSQLLEAMMPNRFRWQPTCARLVAYHLSFDLLYAPSWIIMGIVMKSVVFPHAEYQHLIGFYVLSGLSLGSWSMFGASLFRRQQMSAISVTIISLILAIVGIGVSSGSTETVGIISVFLPPACFINFMIGMTYFEEFGIPYNLNLIPPGRDARWAGGFYWFFFMFQTFLYAILAGLSESILYGRAAKTRKFITSKEESETPVRLSGLTKAYGTWSLRNLLAILYGQRHSNAVLAINKLSITMRRGEITVLLGPNGSGKSTTLACIAGFIKPSSGAIEIENHGGLGICPQQNILWHHLTVREHVYILAAIKSRGYKWFQDGLDELIDACDLGHKQHVQAAKLSGGQKRKLQLAMMLAAGSRICCIDEASTGLDPLSRRHIWDILLAERGKRTIILTTHFLDEADALSDRILILNEGVIRAEGSATELKANYGGLYKVYVPQARLAQLTGFMNTPVPASTEVPIFEASPAQIISFLDQLEKQGIHDFRVQGPTIEDVFMNVDGGSRETFGPGPEDPSDINNSLVLLPGTRISGLQSVRYLWLKRFVLLRRNSWPYILATLIPLFVAAVAGIVFLHKYDISHCDATLAPAAPSPSLPPATIFSHINFVLGPSGAITPEISSSVNNYLRQQSGQQAPAINLQTVQTFSDFEQYIRQNYSTLSPGGLYLGGNDAPATFAYQAELSLYSSVLMLGLLDSLLNNVSTTTRLAIFMSPPTISMGNGAQFILYFGLSLAAYPAFTALYPTLERTRKIRSLQYSNGIRPLPLWTAHSLFDLGFVTLISGLCALILVAVFHSWIGLGYLFVVILIYSCVSVLLGYVISLYSNSQAAAFGIAAGFQATTYAIYIIGYFAVWNLSSPLSASRDLNLYHFFAAAILPAGSLARALLVSINFLGIDCADFSFISSYLGNIELYGGPILYLLIQGSALFLFLLWTDLPHRHHLFRTLKERNRDSEETELLDRDVMAEVFRARDSNDPLRVLSVSKAFGHERLAVDNVSISIARDETFVLLGPNGAGKTTLISLIQDDLPLRSGEIFLDSKPHQTAAAKNVLGVCPQFDALDKMTVHEHLQLYARLRGVPDVMHNVKVLLDYMSLRPYAYQLAETLSGGNRRKLSLAIALIGNPIVLLLDEPTSALDAASKRKVWKTLKHIKAGRSILLTTHSMEEAETLGDRAGIMAQRMLAMGRIDDLHSKYSDGYSVQLMHYPSSSADNIISLDLDGVRRQIQQQFPSAVIERRSYHGQIRFKVPHLPPVPPPPFPAAPAVAVHSSSYSAVDDIILPVVEEDNSVMALRTSPMNTNNIRSIFGWLEENRARLGIEYYSVSATTLENVFMRVVSRHNVVNEDSY